MPARLIDQIVGFYGNSHRLAKALKVAPQTAYRWREQGYLPAKYAKSVHLDSFGEITVDEIEKEAEMVRKALEVKRKMDGGT